jgi:hypothetical protein
MVSCRARLGLFALLVTSACGDDGSAASDETSAGPSTGGASTSTTDATTTTSTPADSTGDGDSTTEDASSTGDGMDPAPIDLCPAGLPFELVREPAGDPIDPAVRTEVTQRYLDLLDEIRYFDFVAERVHGWPQSDPEDRYWYGTWWSGVTVVKEAGAITYRHEDHGADNNGLRTGPLLEGVCNAYALWQRPQDQLLLRRMIRGMTAWIMAMEREADDPDGPLLCRAFYPESIMAEDDGLSFFVDYDLNRPGIDADPSEYVHVPENPHWGDVWIKNKRSKDDIGHMLRAIAQLGTCAPSFDDDTMADYVAMRELYAAWARKVDDDGWRIATLDKRGEVWFPDDLLAYFLPEPECLSVLALRLSGSYAPGDIDCGNGIGPLDEIIINSNDHNGNILRSFHEAAANHAILSGNDEVAAMLLDGMTVRIDEALDGFEGVGEPVMWLGPQDLVDMLAHGAAIGLPLTAREAAWLHARIDEAYTGYAGNPDLQPMLNVFDAATPDGEYGFEPYGPAISFVGLGSLLGTCTSPCRNEASEPVLDCDLVAAHGK